MGKSRMMGAGNASATLYKCDPNIPTGGGNKKQGVTSRVGLDNWENREVQIRSNGIGRFKLFFMNQLGGVETGHSMFGGRYNRGDGLTMNLYTSHLQEVIKHDKQTGIYPSNDEHYVGNRRGAPRGSGTSSCALSFIYAMPSTQTSCHGPYYYYGQYNPCSSVKDIFVNQGFNLTYLEIDGVMADLTTSLPVCNPAGQTTTSPHAEYYTYNQGFIQIWRNTNSPFTTKTKIKMIANDILLTCNV
jgi:hypothetical protein